jgi:hypothetical protein
VLASIAAGAPPTIPAHHSGARRCCRSLGVCRPPAAQAARCCFRSPLLAPSAGVPPTRLAHAGRPLLRPTAQAAHCVARLLPRRRTQAGRRSGTPRQPQLGRPAPLARCWSRATSCRRWSKVARASCGAGLSRPPAPPPRHARLTPSCRPAAATRLSVRCRAMELRQGRTKELRRGHARSATGQAKTQDLPLAAQDPSTAAQ